MVSAAVGLLALKGGCRLRHTGKVKWFNENKGFGFILQEDGGQDIFVHYSEIKQDGFRTLNEGELVEFELTESGKGPQAKEVVRSAGNGVSAAAE